MNCMVPARNGRRFDDWPFLGDGAVTTRKVFGDRDANDGDLLRRWAIEGKGVILKSAWDVVEDIEKGLLEPVLVEQCPCEVDLQIVMPATRHRPWRVTALARSPDGDAARIGQAPGTRRLEAARRGPVTVRPPAGRWRRSAR